MLLEDGLITASLKSLLLFTPSVFPLFALEERKGGEKEGGGHYMPGKCERKQNHRTSFYYTLQIFTEMAGVFFFRTHSVSFFLSILYSDLVKAYYLCDDKHH